MERNRHQEWEYPADPGAGSGPVPKSRRPDGASPLTTGIGSSSGTRRASASSVWIPQCAGEAVLGSGRRRTATETRSASLGDSSRRRPPGEAGEELRDADPRKGEPVWISASTLFVQGAPEGLSTAVHLCEETCKVPRGFEGYLRICSRDWRACRWRRKGTARCEGPAAAQSAKVSPLLPVHAASTRKTSPGSSA